MDEALWMGKPLKDYTKKELIEIVTMLARLYDRQLKDTQEAIGKLL